MNQLLDALRRNIDALGVAAACLAVFLGAHASAVIHQASACERVQPTLHAIGFF
jgi:hypothetical protein